jgi:uncharacterized repeat protein (TIGR01451 family)
MMPAAARASGVQTGPQGIAVDGSGDVYVSDWSRNTIDEITPDGVSVVAGVPGQYGPPTPGPATSSKLNFPSGLAVSQAGDLFIVDSSNCVVEKATPSGTLSVVAGKVGQCGTPTPGPATSSMLAGPIGAAVDSGGNLYIADQGTQSGLDSVIEKVTPSGTLSIIAGELGASGAPTPGPATDSRLDYPQSVAVDDAGNVYIADSLNNVVEKVNPDGILSIFAGELGAGTGTATPGPATNSKFNTPDGVSTDSVGDLYVTDTGNSMIEKVNTADQLSIIAGTGQSGEPRPGPATGSMLNLPVDAAVDSSDNLYIADTGNDLIEKVTPAGDLSIIWNATQPISSVPDLRLTSSAPASVVSGHTFKYTLQVTNPGGQAATGVTVIDRMPASARFDSTSETQGTCARRTSAKPKTAGGTITCRVGSLGGGNGASITIEVTATKPGTVTDTATVSASNVGSDADDSAAATTTVASR